MRRLKIVAIILIISAGVVGSYLIISRAAPAINLGEDLTLTNSASSLDSMPIKWLEKVNDFIKQQESTSSLSSSNSELITTHNPSQQSSTNLTQLVAQNLFGQMKNLDQSGDNPFSADTFDPNNPKNKEALQNAINNLQGPLSYYDLSIDEKAIKISQDNSQQNKTKYLEAVSGIIDKSRTDAYRNPIDAVGRAVMTSDFSGLRQLIETYQNLFNGFLSLSVPSDWLELHKNYLLFMKKAEAVYSGISDVQNDPLKASLFVQMVPDIVNEEIEIRKAYYKLVTG